MEVLKNFHNYYTVGVYAVPSMYWNICNSTGISISPPVSPTFVCSVLCVSLALLQVTVIVILNVSFSANATLFGNFI